MIKAILFDCDGPVVSREFRFSRRLEKDYGITLEDTKDFFYGPFLLCETGKADLEEELKKVIETWGFVGSVKDLIKVWFETESKLDDDFLNFIKSLRDKSVKCFVSTDNEKYRSQYIWETLGLKNYFDGLFSSAHLGFLKSDIGFWEEAYKKISNYEKQEILVWDDEEPLVEQAKAFGFKSELYKDYESFILKMKNYVK